MKLTGFIAVIILLAGCTEDPRGKYKDTPVMVNVEEELIQNQRVMLQQDSLRIEHFISKKEWEMSLSGTGLRYQIYEQSIGKPIETGEQVFLDYTISNLKEDTLYNSERSGIMSLVVDYSEAETGLHELLKSMRRGERARAVVPAHLAHGLVGDDYKIPPMTSLVFDVKVLN